MSDISRFSIYSKMSSNPKRQGEAMELAPFLLTLTKHVALDDVDYGSDPPDFVFTHNRNQIGVELTELLPKLYGKGGYAKKAEFKAWEKTVKQAPDGEYRFEWGKFTVKESLEAFEHQIQTKARGALKWGVAFPEKWLVFNVASGSPFGHLVYVNRRDVPGRTARVNEYHAKKTYAIHSICRNTGVFQQVIFFSGIVLCAFPHPRSNSYGLPTPSSDVLALGATASDEYLNWSVTPRHVTRRGSIGPLFEPNSGQHE